MLMIAATAAFGEPLVGPNVGNADTLVSEGSKLFNQKKYPKASDTFLKATRANPTNVATYLQLARAAMLAKQLTRACYAYRVYLKNTPETPDRKKAAAESDQCERQVAVAKGQLPDLTQKFVETRAVFFAALEKGELLTPGGAAESLRTLVNDGFLGPDLADMASKLGAAVLAEAAAISKRALALEKQSPQVLRSARPMYVVAAEVGLSPPDAKARMAFLDGLAALSEKDYRAAEQLFGEARKADSNNTEYAFYEGLTLYQSGERGKAFKLLEGELKDDPRTAVLRVAQALGSSAEAGAAELEKLLFSTRYPPEK
jgi:tetratricopeptide (TPR) repeat protein